MVHNSKLRLGVKAHETLGAAFRPSIANAPPLPVVNYGLLGQQAPSLLTTPSNELPKASTVVITWTNAEWAALQHVFCSGNTTMAYSNRTRGSWTGWEKYAKGLPHGAPSQWNYWFYYRMVHIGTEPVLLCKSNTHLDWPGAPYLEAMIDLLVKDVQPKLILSIGTAGGAKPQDHIGTVRAVSAGTLYKTGQPSSNWPEYKNAWTGNNTLLDHAKFKQLLFAVPTKTSDLETLCTQFNQHYGTTYTLSQLDPSELNHGDPTPQIGNQTGGGASLLTTSTFVVGTTAGNYEAFTAIEMDDAVIGEACAKSNTAFGFVRNISDPVQAAALPTKVQGNWGSAVYDAYGFYTSYNGAIATWAILAGS